jgi:KUP system potassium uptake protein
MLHNLMHNKVLHERVVVTSVTIEDVPFVPETDRVEVRALKENFWTVQIRYGFKEEPNVPASLALCGAYGLPFSMMETSFFLGRETLIPKLNSEMAFWREKLFVTMFRNADSATNYFNIPTNRVVELGTQVVL